MQKSNSPENNSFPEMMSIETFMSLYGVKSRSNYLKYVRLGWLKVERLSHKSVFITREAAQEFKRLLLASRESKE